MAVVPAMPLVVVSILMIQLQSANRLLLVLSVAPLGMIGIVGGLLVSGRPLGFVAILGALSLVGMIARNAMTLVEQIEAGHDPDRADRFLGPHGFLPSSAASPPPPFSRCCSCPRSMSPGSASESW